MSKDDVKIVVVGDGAVGKTGLITTFGENRFPNEYEPTVNDTYEVKINYEDCGEVTLKLWDTAGQDEFKSVRPIAYNGANAFVVCFDLSQKDTLGNAVDKWRKELGNLGPRQCPKILVGCKKDLRDEKLSSKPDECVTSEYGQEMCDKYKFFAYVETSAKLFENTSAPFQEAVKAAKEMDKVAQSAGGDGGGEKGGCPCTIM